MKNNSGNIKEMLEQLYSDRDQIGDAVFIVESQQIRAHRSILAALSPKYRAQFYGSNPDQGEIQIPDVSAAAFQEFLQFFYKESVNLTMGNIASVLDLTQQSLVEGSIEICVNFLKKPEMCASFIAWPFCMTLNLFDWIVKSRLVSEQWMCLRPMIFCNVIAMF